MSLHREYMVAKGASVWASLSCMSLGDWIDLQWCKVQATGLHPRGCLTVINTHQSLALWENIISQARDEPSGDMLGADISSESLASLANDAWTTLNQWSLSLEDLPEEFDGAELLARWGKRYQQILDEKSWLDSHACMAVLTELIDTNKLQLPSSLWCLGFDNLYPLLDRLIQALSLRCSVSTFDVSLEPCINKVPILDADQEIEYAARWAAQQAGQGQSVAVVVPSLSQDREKVELIFNRVFHPQSWNPLEPRHATGFNISAAQQLVDTPMIAAAIDILSLNRHELSLNAVRRIFGNPFCGEESEQIARTFFLESLASRYEKISPKRLRSELAHFNESHGHYECPSFYQRLGDFIALKPSAAKKTNACQWAQLFEKQLQLMAWPGERKLDTLEYQQLKDWPNVVQSMAMLAELDSFITFEQAYNYLKKTAKVPFHAQTQNSPVQVLGLLEAAGMQFDAIWVAQMTDLTWPEPLKQNPLLPAFWQRQHKMPRSCLERELGYAKALTKRLSKSAHKVIFSWSQWAGDEPLNQSPLIEHFDEAPLSQVLDKSASELSLMKSQSISLDKLIDDQAHRIGEPENIRGGATILKNQSACPFRAFAIHRLKASASDFFTFGMSALDRGILIHAVMAFFWQRVKTHKHLCSLSDNECAQIVRDVALHAWADALTSATKAGVGARIKHIELERTQQVVMAWLKLEKKREPFVVLEHEKKIDLHLAGLPLSIRIDRIDELEDGKTLAVIDYKTGLVNYKKWQGDRPDEPQVPLYTLGQKNVGAAVFASLKKGSDMKFTGIAQRAELFTGLVSVNDLNTEYWPNEWSGLVEQWQKTLTDIAHEFMQGHAAVSPKDATSCQYCDLHSLCRIKDNDSLNIAVEVRGTF